MKPQWTQFEAKYKSKATVVTVDCGNPDSDSYQEYRPFMTEIGSNRIPCTIWLDRKEKVADHKVGQATAEELSQITDRVIDKDK